MWITVKYFAVLAECAQKSEEQIELKDFSIASLYQQLKEQYGFPLEFDEVRTALNTRYVEPETPLKEGDTLVFIAPVAGG